MTDLCQRPISVVFTVPWGDRLGGAENFLLTALGHLDMSTVRPHVVFLQHGPFVREVAAMGIRTDVIAAGRLRQTGKFLNTVQQLSAIIRHTKPDLIVNWTPKTQVYGALGAMMAGARRRVVWWQHGIPDNGWLDRAATFLPAVAIGTPSKVSASAQRSLRPRRPVFTVYPGIGGVERARSRTGAHRVTSDGLDLSGRFVVGIVGRLQPWKGQHLVLDAIAKLQSRGASVHCFVVGDEAYGLSPGYERSLREQVVRLGLQTCVTFTGHVSDVRPYVAMMDVLVNASDVEPFGIVLLEAWAQSVPVVAFHSGGPAEIVTDEVDGLLISRRGDALTSALTRLMDDRALRARLGANGWVRFRAKFTAEQLGRHFAASLLTVVSLSASKSTHRSR